jgi:peptidoglycan/LPS O-acetylase OafA/YrhL
VLKPLTALRFFAALLVFACHVPPTFIAAGRYHTGEAGVEFFFILSGFILIFAHRELFKGHVGFAQVKEFWVARFARIYPVHLLTFCLGMYMVVRVAGAGWFFGDGERNGAALLTQLTLTQSWVPIDSLVNFNMVAWTLSNEAFFYALFPAIAAVLFALVQRAKLWSVGAVALGSWAVSVALATVLPNSWFVQIFPPARLPDFVLGAALGVLFISSGARSPLSFAAATIFEIAAVLALAGAIALTPMVPAHWQFACWMMPFCAFAVYVFAHQRGAVSKLLATAPLVYLGEISYSFYMVHVLVLTAVFSRAWSAPAAVSAIAFVLCVAISAIVYERYERPLRGRIRGFFARPAARAAAAA